MVFDRRKADPEALRDVNEALAAEENRKNESTGTSRSPGASNDSSSFVKQIDVSANIDEQTTSEESGSILDALAEDKHECNDSDAPEVQIPNNETEPVQTDDLPGDSQPLCVDNISEDVEVPPRTPSPVPTEIVPPPPPQVEPFEFTIAPGVIARDYAYHPAPIRPPLLIFPILTTYIWFQYNRWRVIKQKPRNYLNALQSAFIGCDLVYLMHFNWISMKEIPWMDARDWFGQGLVYLYEHPRDVEITYGAKRPSSKSPIVRKWFSRFDKSATIQINTLSKVKPRVNRRYEREDLNGHGPFGEAIYRYFNHETEVFWPLYNYLVGKGPKPTLSEKMERVFEPVLNCHGGGAGGRGKPYERPRDKDDDEPREGTEPREVDVNPFEITMEYSNVPAFVIFRKERWKRRERALRQMLREEEEARAKALARRRRKNYKWTHKKSHKVVKKATAASLEQNIIDLDVEPGRRCTRSMVKVARESNTLLQQNCQTTVKSRKDKGKGKAKALPSDQGSSTGTTHKYDDSDLDYFEQHVLDAGPSSRETRRELEVGFEAKVPNTSSHIDQRIYATKSNWDEAQLRGMKRKRSLAPEPSQGRIDAFKRMRLDQPGASEWLDATPNPRSEETEGEPNGSIRKSSNASSEVDTAEPVKDVVLTQDVGKTPRSLEDNPAKVDGEHSATMRATQDDAGASCPEPDSSSDEQFPPPPSQQLPPAPPSQLGPPPPENPPGPRPLRRTETTLFFGQMHRPRW